MSLNVKVGSAKEVVDLSKKMGVKFTEAGSTYPRGIDFNDSNIRIAPSYPPIEELQTAMQVLRGENPDPPCGGPSGAESPARPRGRSHRVTAAPVFASCGTDSS